jgi:hypothetical protein
VHKTIILSDILYGFATDLSQRENGIDLSVQEQGAEKILGLQKQAHSWPSRFVLITKYDEGD